MLGLLPLWTRRPIAKVVERFAPDIAEVRNHWLLHPDLGPDEEICLFVAFAPGSVIPSHSLYQARAWADAGFRVVMLVISDAFSQNPRVKIPTFASGLNVRENRGYDFGAWATALKELPEIRSASLLVLANDSLFGPLNNFETMLKRVRAMDADVIGATEGQQLGRHFQSYLLFFKGKALSSTAFWTFWANVRAGGRFVAIYRYEVELLAAMERGGLNCVSLFGGYGSENPTLLHWRGLIDKGFPFVKVAVFRDNPCRTDLSGWRKILSDRGYDAALVEERMRPLRANLLFRAFSRFR